MNIAIIGAGNVGQALGSGWAALGHTVIFGTRSPDRDDMVALTTRTGTQAALPADAAAQAEVLLLATPWNATQAVLENLGDLTGKVLLDATNPIGPGLALIGDPSGGEQVAAWAPGAHVVKAFNTTGFENMQAPSYDGTPLAMFYCGDDASAKATAADLIAALGFDAIDAGPLSRAVHLEHLAMVWITQAFTMGAGRDFGFAVLRR